VEKFASAENKGGYANFHRIAPQVSYHSNVSWVIAKRLRWSCPPTRVPCWRLHFTIIGLQGDR